MKHLKVLVKWNWWWNFACVSTRSLNFEISLVPLGNCFRCYFRQLFMYLALRKCKNDCKILTITLVLDLCPLKPEIARFSIGFRLNISRVDFLRPFPCLTKTKISRNCQNCTQHCRPSIRIHNCLCKSGKSLATKQKNYIHRIQLLCFQHLNKKCRENIKTAPLVFEWLLLFMHANQERVKPLNRKNHTHCIKLLCFLCGALFNPLTPGAFCQKYILGHFGGLQPEYEQN